MSPKTTLSSALLGALLIAGCGEAAPTGPAAAPVAPVSSLSATSDWQAFAVWYDGTFYNQCVGEDLRVTGTLSIRLHTVVPPGTQGRFLELEVGLDDNQWEGLTTHQIWTPVPGGNHHALVATESWDFVVGVQRLTHRNQSTGAVMDWPWRVTFVTNAAGEVVVDRFEFDACRLRD